jgi:hypothetical protein
VQAGNEVTEADDWPRIVAATSDAVANGRFADAGRRLADDLHDTCRRTAGRPPLRPPVSARMRRELIERACGDCEELGRAVLRIANSRWRELVR